MKKITKQILNKIKAILTIHILGNSSNIEEITNKKNGIYLIEELKFQDQSLIQNI